MRKLFETASSSEESSEQVDKIAKAAQVLRWSEQIVEAKRAQMQSITKLQIQTMDHMMDALEEIKLPSQKTASPSALLSKLKSYCRALAKPAVSQTRRLAARSARSYRSSGLRHLFVTRGGQPLHRRRTTRGGTHPPWHQNGETADHAPPRSHHRIGGA
jgi:hypothetical protein